MFQELEPGFNGTLISSLTIIVVITGKYLNQRKVLVS